MIYVLPLKDIFKPPILNQIAVKVSFSSCQRNLIKTFQTEGMFALITKMDLIFSCYTAKNRCQKVPNSDFQSQFSTSKITRNFQKKIFC